MKKIYRIKKNEDIKLVLDNKKSAGNKNYIIYIMKNSEAKNFRVAMSVSKKIGNAVVRNRQKRLIRQVFTSNKDKIKLYEIFVIARSNVVNLTYDEIESNILYLLNKLNVLQEEN